MVVFCSCDVVVFSCISVILISSFVHFVNFCHFYVKFDEYLMLKYFVCDKVS